MHIAYTDDSSKRRGPRAAAAGTLFARAISQALLTRARALVSLERVSRRTGQQRGALLLVFNQSKDHQLDPASMKALAELLRSAMVAAGHPAVRPELCMVVDVFGGAVATAPTRGQRIANEIASACREIAMRWPALRSRRAA